MHSSCSASPLLYSSLRRSLVVLSLLSYELLDPSWQEGLKRRRYICNCISMLQPPIELHKILDNLGAHQAEDEKVRT